MKKRNTSIVILLTMMITAVVPAIAIDYPPARRDTIVDDYYGTKVADPYRWLEDPDSKETLDWVNAENKITAEFVNTPEREKIKDRYAFQLIGFFAYPCLSVFLLTFKPQDGHTVTSTEK